MHSAARASAHDFLSFVNASPTPFHAVQSVKDKLAKAGFKEIKEKESWAFTCRPGGKYFLTRNTSTIVAFAVGKKWKPGSPIAMVGAHTDSPCLRIKPNSKKQGEGFVQVGVELYGGGLWHTWFDRDLSVAGRLMTRQADGSIAQRLIHVKKPILRIPTLAIHLDRQETFSFNKETQLFPIAGLVSAQLNRKEEPDAEEDGFEPLELVTQRHHPYLIKVVAESAKIDPSSIVDFELVLYDTQKACLGGLKDEFIFSARLDNLNQTYCATMGLIESVSGSDSLEDESSVRLVACFDHEEIGSMTAQGAFSSMLSTVIRRLSALPAANFESESESSYDQAQEVEAATAFEQSLASSFLLSADMAHSVHPNYAGKYESDHKAEMNKGPVIKVNANARYATNSPGIVLLQEVARLAPKLDEQDLHGVPLQLFVVRNDSSCGSTIGPMLSASLGVRTLDLGNPQLSMHSIRETGGSEDVHHAIRLFSSFYRHYAQLEKTILVD